MQSSSINDVVKTLLLSSPPGQFDVTLSNIQSIVSPNDDNNSMLLSNEFIQEVKEEYNHQTGRSILSMTTNNDNNDEFEKGTREEDFLLCQYDILLSVAFSTSHAL